MVHWTDWLVQLVADCVARKVDKMAFRFLSKGSTSLTLYFRGAFCFAAGSSLFPSELHASGVGSTERPLFQGDGRGCGKKQHTKLMGKARSSEPVLKASPFRSGLGELEDLHPIIKFAMTHSKEIAQSAFPLASPLTMWTLTDIEILEDQSVDVQLETFLGQNSYTTGDDNSSASDIKGLVLYFTAREPKSREPLGSGLLTSAKRKFQEKTNLSLSSSPLSYKTRRLRVYIGLTHLDHENTSRQVGAGLDSTVSFVLISRSEVDSEGGWKPLPLTDAWGQRKAEDSFLEDSSKSFCSSIDRKHTFQEECPVLATSNTVSQGFFQGHLKAISQSSDTERILSKIVATDDVVLFLKGTAAAPQCSCSAALVKILLSFGISFAYVDVTHADFDPKLREALSQRASDTLNSKTSTSPLLFINGELIGGLLEVQRLAQKKQRGSKSTWHNKRPDNVLLSMIPWEKFHHAGSVRSPYIQEIKSDLGSTGE